MDTKELIELIERLKDAAKWVDAHGRNTNTAIGEVCDEAAAALTALTEENDKIWDELEQVKRDRDAAVADLKTMVDKHGECVGCKFGNGKAGCGDVECDTHAHNHWEWRGPRKEE